MIRWLLKALRGRKEKKVHKQNMKSRPGWRDGSWEIANEPWVYRWLPGDERRCFRTTGHRLTVVVYRSSHTLCAVAIYCFAKRVWYSSTLKLIVAFWGRKSALKVHVCQSFLYKCIKYIVYMFLFDQNSCLRPKWCGFLSSCVYFYSGFGLVTKQRVIWKYDFSRKHTQTVW